MPRTSMLRLTLLHELQNEPAASVTELAARVGKLRPSVSRSLHRLQAQGLVELEGKEWRITSPGRDEAGRATERLRKSAAGLNDVLVAITPKVTTPPASLKAFGALDSVVGLSDTIAAITPRVTTPLASLKASRALDLVGAELGAAFPAPGTLGIEKALRAGALNANSLGITALFETQTGLARFLGEIEIPRWDIPDWRHVLLRWRPDNLHEVPDLDSVATVALEEGLPLSWVPRPEIVAALIEAHGPEARLAIISERREDILDDCEVRLGDIAHEWAVQSLEAVRALRLGLVGPAQSHAASIVDSIVVSRYGDRGRRAAREHASESRGDQPLQRAAEHLTILPLNRALAAWRPHAEVESPDHFSRHATAHGVGHAGVFAPHFAMTAVMLATSLTVQFASHETAAGGEAHRSAAEAALAGLETDGLTARTAPAQV